MKTKIGYNSIMETNFFVKLDEFEREMTIENYEDVVKLMRYLMNRELELVNTLPKVEDHDGKIRAYQKRTADVEIRKGPRKVLRGPDPMPIGSVELMWTIGLTADSYIAFVALMAIGNVHKLVTEPFAVYKTSINEHTRRTIVVHTHPSQVEVAPSPGDLAFTKGLLYASSQLNFIVEDHIILGAYDTYSFRQHDQLLALKKELETELTDKQELELRNSHLLAQKKEAEEALRQVKENENAKDKIIADLQKELEELKALNKKNNKK